ncbi:MAG: hypothetical protein KDD44_06635, partial [Bdellovibrionales bacterium]|nr:hypothetical protein [Bdellovibrionales bacterium]
QAAGRPSRALGLDDTALVGAAEEPTVDVARKQDAALVAVSRFQLEDAVDFSPRVGVLLSSGVWGPVAADTAPQETLYARVFHGQECPGDWSVLPSTTQGHLLAPRAAARGSLAVYGGRVDPDIPTAFIVGPGTIQWSDAHGSECYDIRGFRPMEAHNRSNLLAAIAAAKLSGIPGAAIQSAISQITPLPHRLDPFTSPSGAIVIDDTSATTPDALRAALAFVQQRPVRERLVLIIGGHKASMQLRPLCAAIAASAHAIYIVGRDSEELCEILRREAANGSLLSQGPEVVQACAGLDDAMRRALAASQSGDLVVCSPGCASFDSYRCAEERGADFQAIARQAGLRRVLPEEVGR